MGALGRLYCVNRLDPKPASQERDERTADELTIEEKPPRRTLNPVGQAAKFLRLFNRRLFTVGQINCLFCNADRSTSGITTPFYELPGIDGVSANVFCDRAAFFLMRAMSLSLTSS